MEKQPVSIIADVYDDDFIIEPKGATMIEIIRDVTCDYTVRVMNAITLNDDNRAHLFAYDKDFEIKTSIPVKFSGSGTIKKVVVIKSIYEEN